jgi:hypothetical protein
MAIISFIQQRRAKAVQTNVQIEAPKQDGNASPPS